MDFGLGYNLQQLFCNSSIEKWKETRELLTARIENFWTV